MIDVIFAVIASLAPTPLEVDALRETAPLDLSPTQAREHLVAARIAARAHGVDAADLLAIAYHESRYVETTVTREPRGVSCGVMTPYDHPRARCAPELLTVVGGYMHGAEHLAVWKRICHGDRLCALRGYSGDMVDRQAGNRGMRTWRVFAARSADIRRALSVASSASRTRSPSYIQTN